MKIVHICLETPYINGWLYQENLLPRHQAELGHDVTVIASQDILPNYLQGKIDYSKFIEPYMDGPVRVVRIKSSFSFLKRINYYHSLSAILNKIKPDLLYFHGGQSLSLLVAKHYVDQYDHAKLFVDFHSEFYNSARGWISRVILHRLIWKSVLSYCLPSISQIYCICRSTKEFCEKLYNIPSERMAYLFLGVEPIHIEPGDREHLRRSIRSELGMSPGDFMLVTGGKLNPDKQIGLLVRAMELVDRESVRLLVFGAADAPHQSALENLLKSAPRIHYVNWCDAEAINRYFLASDLAVFPGGQSVLWQQSIAAGLPGIYRKWAGHEHLNQGNCCYLFSDSPEELAQWLRLLSAPEGTQLLESMKKHTLALAQGEMSYRMEAERVISRYEECLNPPTLNKTPANVIPD